MRMKRISQRKGRHCYIPSKVWWLATLTGRGSILGNGMMSEKKLRKDGEGPQHQPKQYVLYVLLVLESTNGFWGEKWNNHSNILEEYLREAMWGQVALENRQWELLGYYCSDPQET